MKNIKFGFIPLIFICVLCMPKVTHQPSKLMEIESKQIVSEISNLAVYICTYLKNDTNFIEKKKWDQLSEEQKNSINTYLEKSNRKIEIVEITNQLPQRQNKPLVSFMLMKMSEKQDSIQIWLEASFGRRVGGGEIYLVIKKENEYFISKHISHIYH
jgi:hypothetical protein